MDPPVVLSSRTKELAIGKMRQNEAALAAKIDEMVARGELSVDEEGGVVGCDPLCGLLRRRRRRRVPAEAGAAKSQSGLEKAVFGARSGKTMTAAERLAQAAESVQAHASQLSERSAAARARALELQMAGKKADALMALKRAKALEKQAATALSTHAALESQQDMLESSALQREIASALSASVASTKSKSKGLLSKTETAVDDAAELKDAFEEVTEALGRLQAQYGDDDDEELLAELQSMVAEVPWPRPPRRSRRPRRRRSAARRPPPRRTWPRWWPPSPRRPRARRNGWVCCAPMRPRGAARGECARVS